MRKYNYWRIGQKKLTKLPRHCEVLFAHSGKWKDEHGDPQEWEWLTRRWPRPTVKAKATPKPKAKPTPAAAAAASPGWVLWYPGRKKPHLTPDGCEWKGSSGVWFTEFNDPDHWKTWPRRWPDRSVPKVVKPLPVVSEHERLLLLLLKNMVYKPDGWFSATRTGYFHMSKTDARKLRRVVDSAKKRE